MWGMPEGAITGFHVEIQTAEETFKTVDRNLCAGERTECILPMNVLIDDPFNMIRYTEIQMRVRAFNANGEGPWAYSNQAKDEEDYSPLKLDLPPTMKIAATMKDKKIELTWPGSLDPTSSSSYYELLGREGEDDFKNLVKLPSNLLSYTLGDKITDGDLTEI